MEENKQLQHTHFSIYAITLHMFITIVLSYLMFEILLYLG